MNRDKYDKAFDSISGWILIFLLVLLVAKSCWHLQLVKEEGHNQMKTSVGGDDE